MDNTFLNSLKNLRFASAADVEQLVERTDSTTLADALIVVEKRIKPFPLDEWFFTNIRHAIIGILKRRKLSEETELLLTLKNTLVTIDEHRPSELSKLLELDIGEVLAISLKKETEKQALWSDDDDSLSIRIISIFLPSISDTIYQDINVSSNEILRKGRINIKELVINFIKHTFPTLFSICKIPNCPTLHRILLLKMIYWANKLNELPNLIAVQELLQFTHFLMDKNPLHKDSFIIGFVILITLFEKYTELIINEGCSEWLRYKFGIVSAWAEDSCYIWMPEVYRGLVTFWLSKETVSRLKIDDESLISKTGNVTSILEFIMPNSENGMSIHAKFDENYARLREFTKDILNLPDVSRLKEKLTVRSEDIKRFNDLVQFTVKTLDAIMIRFDFMIRYKDLVDIEEYQHVPKTHMDIQLELCRSAAFDRVLGSSKSRGELKRNPLIRTLRLLSILYEVNENWGILFCNLSKERLVDRSCFISEVFDEVMTNVEKTPNMFPSYLDHITAEYPFLFSVKHRQFILRYQLSMSKKSQLSNSSKHVTFAKMPRKNLLNHVAKRFNKMEKHTNNIWKFTFYEEQSLGEGPSKEFYSEFSRDCQRFDMGLWSGEPGEEVDGVSYVNSDLGLFPLPIPRSNSNRNSCLRAIGLIMAKAIEDDRRFNINFSNAFYKCLFQSNLYAQILSLKDIKDVVTPSTFKFVQSLVDALREKLIIQNDINMTPEDKTQALLNITCDGCSFEDICINFVLPGFPDIEMVEGGSDIFLSIENLELYLQLLVWCLLYKNPQQSIKEISIEFRKVLNPHFMIRFYPDECDELLCGLTQEQWTVDYLKQNCKLDKQYSNIPAVQYLFEVLSSLSASDQRNFLQFVTGSPRLPIGGLAALKPKFTVGIKRADGNPDQYLPSTFTCHNTLFITKYSCKEALEEKLLKAIREGRNSFQFD